MIVKPSFFYCGKTYYFKFHVIFPYIQELESKSEYAMPFSSGVKLVETTKCNNLIAVALKNNNIVIFDLNAGNCQCVSYVSK